MTRTLLVMLVATLAFGQQARAGMVSFSFSGLGFSGSGTFTVVPNVSPPDPNPLCATAGNCRSDPPGAYRITDFSVTFSDANIGLTASITGLVPTHPSNVSYLIFDPLVPASLSLIDYTNETPGNALSYNNLFFPAGSPIDCAYPLDGTFLDVFGTAFTVAGGDTVDFWGDGNAGPGGALTYGIGVTDGTNLLDYKFAGVSAAVPEPGSVWLLGAGLLGLLAWRRGLSASRVAAP